MGKVITVRKIAYKVRKMPQYFAFEFFDAVWRDTSKPLVVLISFAEEYRPS